MRWTILALAAGTLTAWGGRSPWLISKAETEVETLGLWAVWWMTISQYLKIQRAKLNTHTDASGSLCTCSWNTYSLRRKITVTDLQSGNRGGDPEIMGGLFDNNKSILEDTKGQTWILTLTPAAACALVVSESQAGIESMRSVATAIADVEVAGTAGPCMEPRDGFLDLKTFL